MTANPQGPVRVVPVEPTEAMLTAIDAGLHDHWPDANSMAKAAYRAMIAAAPAVAPALDAEDRSVEFQVWQDDCFCSGSSSEDDASHYATVYGQDGPVERKTAITFTFDGFLDHDSILAVLRPGGAK